MCRLEASRAACPTLLATGRLMSSGPLPATPGLDGGGGAAAAADEDMHYGVWESTVRVQLGRVTSAIGTCTKDTA